MIKFKLKLKRVDLLRKKRSNLKTEKKKGKQIKIYNKAIIRLKKAKKILNNFILNAKKQELALSLFFFKLDTRRDQSSTKLKEIN